MSGHIPTVNLIPESRRTARARRVAVGRWFVACTLVALGSLTPAGVFAVTSSTPGEDLSDRVLRAERAIARMAAEEPALKRRLTQLQQTEKLLAVIEDRPAWMPLLHAVSGVAGDARFERIEAGIEDKPTPAVTVQMTVLFESPSAGRAFVLRLEELGIFDQVTLRASNQIALSRSEVERCEIVARINLGGKR